MELEAVGYKYKGAVYRYMFLIVMGVFLFFFEQTFLIAVGILFIMVGFALTVDFLRKPYSLIYTDSKGIHIRQSYKSAVIINYEDFIAANYKKSVSVKRHKRIEHSYGTVYILSKTGDLKIRDVCDVEAVAITLNSCGESFNKKSKK